MANNSLMIASHNGEVITTSPTWEELETPVMDSDSHPNFLEGNSQAISFHDLRVSITVVIKR